MIYSDLHIECIGPANRIDEFCRRVLSAADELPFTCKLTPVASGQHICFYPGEDEIRIEAPEFPRSAHLRLILSRQGLVETTAEAFLIGMDQRAGSDWQHSALLTCDSEPAIRHAIERLILDPLFTGYVGPIQEQDRLQYNHVHLELFKNQLASLHPETKQRQSAGRILWIEANPHVDSVLDPYGLSVLSEIASQQHFASAIISPFNEFESPLCDTGRVLQSYKPDLVGISLRNIDDVVTIRSFDTAEDCIHTSNYLRPVKELIEEVRKKFSGPLLLGGAALSRSPKELMAYLGIRYGVQGPGEAVIQTLLSQWSPPRTTESTDFSETWSRIPGTLSLSGDVLQHSSATGRANSSLRHVPRNPWKLWQENRLGIPTAVRGTYGCPLNCDYCIEGTPGIKISQRNPADIVDEMEYLFEQYNIHSYHLTDSEANLPFSRLRALAAEISRRRLGNVLSWTVYATPAPFPVDELPLLVAGGLRSLKLSVDHFWPAQLKSLGRVHTEKAIHTLLTALSAFSGSLKVTASILFGAKGESAESIRYAADHMKAYADEGIIFYYNPGIRIYPGTRIYTDWISGALDPAHCYGSGKDDDALSPLVYCSPDSPQALSKMLYEAFREHTNIHGIDSGRPISGDEPLRKINIAFSKWYSGNVKEAVALLQELMPGTDGSNIYKRMIEYEWAIRNEHLNKFEPDWH